MLYTHELILRLQTARRALLPSTIFTMSYRKIGRLAVLALIWLPLSCGKDTGPKQPNFDRGAMLEHYADQLIVPAFQQLNQQADSLLTSWNHFRAKPDSAQLGQLRAQWFATALAFESANAFNFGPVGEQGTLKSLVEEIGLFPVSVAKVEGFIATGDTTLNNFDRDSRGLFAIEYLIYGTTDNTQDVLQALQEPTRMAYLGALFNHLKQRVGSIVSNWPAYRTTFIKNDGTDAGSATSSLYNEFVRSFENLKNFKVALPAGKRAGQTQAEPQLVEAYYSKRSIPLLEAHLASIERIYDGTTLAGAPGAGLRAYLLQVEGGPALVSATEAQWQAVQSAFSQLPTSQPLSTLIQNGDPSVEALFVELQKHTRFFKSDMSSLLGIAITYNSGDGD